MQAAVISGIPYKAKSVSQAFNVFAITENVLVFCIALIVGESWH